MSAARVARLCLPGPMWYLAVCEDCSWAGMSWKQRMWAVNERDQHNNRHALSVSSPSPTEEENDG